MSGQTYVHIKAWHIASRFLFSYFPSLHAFVYFLLCPIHMKKDRVDYKCSHGFSAYATMENSDYMFPARRITHCLYKKLYEGLQLLTPPYPGTRLWVMRCQVLSILGNFHKWQSTIQKNVTVRQQYYLNKQSISWYTSKIYKLHEASFSVICRLQMQLSNFVPFHLTWQKTTRVLLGSSAFSAREQRC
jgi:hypothetical protein